MQAFYRFIFFGILSIFISSYAFSCKSIPTIKDKRKSAKTKAVANSSSTEQAFEAEKNKQGDAFPEMNFLNSRHELMFDTQIVKNKPILFVMFNPGCFHCKDLMGNIRDSLSLFEGATILYLCGEPNMNLTDKFAKELRVDNIPSIIVASDLSMITTQVFEYKGIPQIMMYDKDHKLQHIFYKDASVKDILPHLFNNAIIPNRR